MSITHYFSKNPDKRAKFIFNLIAPLYGKLDNKLQEGFKYSSIELDKEIMVTGKTVLDIGSGTGAWGASINKLGALKTEGIDFSEKMVKQAKKNHPGINFSVADAESLSDFEDNSFDIVTASFVLHGVKKEKRKKMLNEMKRISKKYVVLHDFIGRTPVFIRFLEFLERSDYKNFKKNFCSELEEKFPKTTKISSKFGSGLYIAEKNKNENIS
ncbi:MAG: class I SAM-dependent methyltransferase [Bacteroidales bacterium]|nr:class I SAM-dependent methyltransferase [Bacteroidales bacterium]